MQHFVGPSKMICVEFEGEGSLSIVTNRNVEVVQLVNVTEEHFITILFRPVKIEKVNCARHALVTIAVARLKTKME